MPSWSLAAQGGPDPGAVAAFTAGLGICLYAGLFVFCLLIGWHLLKKLLAAAGL